MKESSLSWEWQTDKNTFNNVNVSYFKNTRFSTIGALILRILSILLTVVMYVSDCYTCVKLLAYNSWGSEIEPAIPFSISRWIFSGCIVLSIILLIYEWIYALKIYASGNISLTYTNTIARDLWSCKGYSYFCLYNQVNPADFFDYCSFMVYFTLKGCVKLIFAESPRQIINGITIISTIKDNSGSIITNYEQFTSNDTKKAWAIVFSVMALSFVIWVIFMVKFIVALLASTCVISSINKRGYNLKQYVCIRINDRVNELSKNYHISALARKESSMALNTKSSTIFTPPSLSSEFTNSKSVEQKPSVSSFNSSPQMLSSPIYNNIGRRRPSDQNLRRVPYNPKFNNSDLTVDNNNKRVERRPPPPPGMAYNLSNNYSNSSVDSSSSPASKDIILANRNEATKTNINSPNLKYRPPPSMNNSNERKHPLVNQYTNGSDSRENIELKSYPTSSSFSSMVQNPEQRPEYMISPSHGSLENTFHRLDTSETSRFSTYTNNSKMGSSSVQTSSPIENPFEGHVNCSTTSAASTQVSFASNPLTSTPTMQSPPPVSRVNTANIQSPAPVSRVNTGNQSIHNESGANMNNSLPYPKEMISPQITSPPMLFTKPTRTQETSSPPYVTRVNTLPYASDSAGFIQQIQKASTFSADSRTENSIYPDTPMIYMTGTQILGSNHDDGEHTTPYNLAQATGGFQQSMNYQTPNANSWIDSSVSTRSQNPLLTESKYEDDVSPYTNTGRWDTFEDVFGAPHGHER